MTTHPEFADWSRFLWEITKGVAMALAAVFSFVASQQSAHNGDAVAQLKFDADSRARRAELDLKVYELVEKALSVDGPAAKGHGVAAAALINALTIPPLRSQLLNALSAGTKDPELRKQLDDMQRFDDQDAQPGASPTPVSPLDHSTSRLVDALFPPLLAQALPGSLKGYRVDIFYCEGQRGATEARQKRAQTASDRLKPAGTQVIVKIRNLPTFVQARPEYKSAADEIRFNDGPKEREAAKLLATTIGIAPEYIRKIDSKTPGYISVFYCGA